jgi:hypothetical protein
MDIVQARRLLKNYIFLFFVRVPVHNKSCSLVSFYREIFGLKRSQKPHLFNVILKRRQYASVFATGLEIKASFE